MKVLYFYLLTVAVSSEFVPREYYPWKRTQLTTVTHFKKFEEFYLTKMRLQKSKSLEAEREYPDETAEVKKTLCDKILSNHEQVEKEFVLNMDVGGVRHDLKRDSKELYDEIFMFPKNDASSGPRCCSFRSARRTYVNEYVSINAIVDGETVTEYVFKCLARNKVTRDIIQYYISEEYNVNIRRSMVNNIQPRYITGRFVFFQDSDEEWRLLEMAEESAILTPLAPTDTYERIYLKYRKNHEIAEDQTQDPVCGLDDGHKLRLCVSVMNTSEMTGRGKTPQFVQKYNNFNPESQKADKRCVKREVKFSTDIARVYEELTISCTVETLHETERGKKNIETFVVSRGYKMNSIFVFRLLRNGKISVDHHSFNVSVVDDQTVQTERGGPEKIEY